MTDMRKDTQKTFVICGVILGVLFLALIGKLLGSHFDSAESPNSPHTPTIAPVVTEPPLPIVSVAHLWCEYNTNEVNADNEYKGKEVVLDGKVGSISKGLDGSPFITLEAYEPPDIRAKEDEYEKQISDLSNQMLQDDAKLSRDCDENHRSRDWYYKASDESRDKYMKMQEDVMNKSIALSNDPREIEYGKANNAHASIICSFDPAKVSGLSSLSPGYIVRVRGTVDGLGVSNIMVSDCSLTK